MNKKAITPIIAVILLLMMTVAAAGAAFYWLTRIQGQMQTGAEQYQTRMIRQAAAQVDVSDASYNSTSEVLTIFLRNSGNTPIPITNSSTAPKATWIVKKSTQDMICGTDWSGTLPAVTCTYGCGGTLGIGDTQKVTLNLNATDCDLDTAGVTAGDLVYFTIDFNTITTTSSSFVK